MHTTARQGEHALRDGASTRTDAASPSPGGDLPTTHTIVRVGTNAGARAPGPMQCAPPGISRVAEPGRLPAS